MSEATLLELDSSDDSEIGVGCEKCGYESDASACPRCGWYPMLGIHVEIDEAWESLAQPPTDPEDAEPSAPRSEWENHLQVWREMIPTWGWVMIATILAVVAASIVARIASMPSPSLQSMLGVGGLLVGAAVACGLHFFAFLICSFDDAEIGVMDLLIKPMKIWKKIGSELPERLWLADGALAGVTLSLCAVLIIGGIPYDNMLDWGFKERPKQSLIGAIAQRAAQGGSGSDNLEDAISDFAGTADGLSEGDTPKNEAANSTPKIIPRTNLDCLIIGYNATDEGQLTRLLLASEAESGLKYIGAVSPEFDDREQAKVLEKFAQAQTSRPFIKSSETAVWLKPRFTCRVSYTRWPEGKRPKDVEWREMLDEIDW